MSQAQLTIRPLERGLRFMLTVPIDPKMPYLIYVEGLRDGGCVLEEYEFDSQGELDALLSGVCP